ncbi:MAG: flagellar hook-basal body complex protein, partial [Clostridiales bacterium]|nr:flagellar hook-basal body complex protein [Clostridiales bacterium]
MMRSLFSGVSGLKVHQTKMDVIGNNISNVNTVGFKSSSVNFSDIFYQTTQNATGPNATTGTTGRNAMQIGLGASIASVTQAISTQGAAQRTDNPFDIMIEGDAFFVVQSGGTNYFTKAGSFGVDAYGTLCTPSGAAVMGWQVDDNDPKRIVQDTVSKLNIMGPDNLYSQPEATKAGYLAGNIDSLDEQLTDPDGKIVNISFYDKTGQSYTADLSIKSTGNGGEYSVEVTDIVDYDGNSIFTSKKADGTYELGGITRFDFAGIEYTATAVDSVTGEVTLSKSVPDALINFNPSNGEFISVTGAEDDTVKPDEAIKSIGFTVYSSGYDGTDPTTNAFESIDLNFSSLTQYGTSGSSNITAIKGSLDGKDSGRTFGNMTGVTVDGSGKLYGKYDNGDSKLL